MNLIVIPYVGKVTVLAARLFVFYMVLFSSTDLMEELGLGDVDDLDGKMTFKQHFLTQQIDRYVFVLVLFRLLLLNLLCDYSVFFLILQFLSLPMKSMQLHPLIGLCWQIPSY